MEEQKKPNGFNVFVQFITLTIQLTMLPNLTEVWGWWKAVVEELVHYIFASTFPADHLGRNVGSRWPEDGESTATAIRKGEALLLLSCICDCLPFQMCQTSNAFLGY